MKINWKLYVILKKNLFWKICNFFHDRKKENFQNLRFFHGESKKNVWVKRGGDFFIIDNVFLAIFSWDFEVLFSILEDLKNKHCKNKWKFVEIDVESGRFLYIWF